MIRLTVAFHGAPPSVDLVLAELARRTGLDLVVHMKTETGALFSHPEFDCSYPISRTDRAIVVTFGITETSYLLWALVSTLKALGGNYDGEIPLYADKRWDELTDVHDEVRYAR